MLGAALHLGSGISRDRIAAFSWLIRARAGGSPLANSYFAAVQASLSADELAEAERLAGAALPEPAP
jgi:hypothetical protein